MIEEIINEKPNKLRCAIYTRKSSEEGLDLEFNSLQAQSGIGTPSGTVNKRQSLRIYPF